MGNQDRKGSFILGRDGSRDKKISFSNRTFCEKKNKEDLHLFVCLFVILVT